MNPYIRFKLPIEDLVDVNRFINELIEANKYLGIYETLLNKSKLNLGLLLGPITLQESVLSTRIEGTQVTIDDVFEYEADESKKNSDIQEVINYSDALRTGEYLLSSLPISTRLIKELHKILLQGDVRGKSRTPGEFRKIQNFIGPSGCTIETASYVPPEPQRVDEYMSNLENYINDPKDNLNDIIRVAIIPAQFETIHPFLDGNGRIGRILIPLYLYDKKIIQKPIFFLSESLEKDKFKYYRLLNDIRVVNTDSEDYINIAKDRWSEWIKFFINSVITQSKKNIALIEDIDNLYEDTLNESRKLISNNKLIDIINFMFERPIFTQKMIRKSLTIPQSTLSSYLNKLEDAKIIYSDNKKRNRKYYFYSLLELLRR